MDDGQRKRCAKYFAARFHVPVPGIVKRHQDDSGLDRGDCY